MKIFGIFIVLFDLIKLALKSFNIEKIYRTIKHQILVQSWWRALIFFILVGLIGALFNIYAAFGSIFLFGIIINHYQKEYAKSRKRWDDFYKNEHLVIPFAVSILFLTLIYTIIIDFGVPKYSFVKEINLNKNTVTNLNTVYISVEDKIIALDTGPNCTIGQDTKIYKETISSKNINMDFYSNYYLECHKSMKKITKI